ncbi:MAG: hypothetical protein LBU65_12270 [Planctomycetaceae bacterium]|jgi:hypothetical protein|nr:hypothetical protein [Planctomycetaceae bacterium]
MKIHYALYDPATAKDGQYWTWLSSELKNAPLNKYYGDFAAKHLAPNPNDLIACDLWGGIVRLPTGDWTVVYRVLNGGDDKIGRPGRYVIITAWMKTSETLEQDLSSIFNSILFRSIAEHSTELPVPEPQPALLTEEMQFCRIPSAFTGEKTFTGTECVEKSVAAFAGIPSDGIESIHLKIEKTSMKQNAEIDIVVKQKPKPPEREKPAEPTVISPVNKPDGGKPKPPAPPNNNNMFYKLLLVCFLALVAAVVWHLYKPVLEQDNPDVAEIKRKIDTLSSDDIRKIREYAVSKLRGRIPPTPKQQPQNNPSPMPPPQLDEK